VFVAVQKYQKRKEFRNYQQHSVCLCTVPDSSLSTTNLLLTHMVYQRISADWKQQALYLFLEQGWEIEHIVAALGVSEKSVEPWEENYDIHGHVNPPTHLQGCPRLLND
jgi:hypothetical protein